MSVVYIRGILFSLLVIQFALLCWVSLTMNESQQPQIKFSMQQRIPGQYLVDIGGAVNYPGVYQVTVGERLADVVNMAGGLTKDADLGFVNEQLNLAVKVEDADKFFIPYATTVAESNDFKSDVVQSANRININTASAAELEAITGVGPSTAAKIIQARPFTDIKELEKVSGIGPKTVEKIVEQVEL